MRGRGTDSVDEAAGGSIDVGIGETVEELTPADGLGAVKEVVNKLARLVGASCIAMALCGATSLNDMPGTNTIYTAAETDARIIELAPVPDISGKADTSNVYTKAETDAKIVELAPTPGDYATVSNRAMMAITGNDLGAFAATGTVWRAESYGTPNRWTDATGCVWEVVANVWFDHRNGNIFVNGVSIFPSDTTAGDMKGYLYYDPSAMEYVGETGGGWYYNGENTSGTPSVLAGGPDATSLYSGNLTLGDLTNLVGRVALTSDIPDTSGFATPEDVTAAIREQSLGGIWDNDLEVWWTPIMQNGALKYVATTNVNLEVNQ